MARPKMSNEDCEQLTRLLYQYVETELDQFDNWRLEPEGWSSRAYVSISLKPLSDYPDSYDLLPRPGTRRATGRFAHASADAVTSREDLRRVIAELLADLDHKGWREWENASLPRFLEALEAVLDGGAVGHAATGDDQPTWARLAAALIAATGYE